MAIPIAKKSVFSKNLRREDGNDGVGMAPTTGLEAGLAARVIEKGVPIPAVLYCHLRQKEAARRPAFEEDSVPADDNSVEIDPPQRRQSGDLDVRVGKFINLQWPKTGVLEGGGDGVVPNRSPQRRDADHMADTTSEAAVDLEGHKGAARFEKRWIGRLGRGEGIPVQATVNRLTCESEQKPGRRIVDGVLGGTGNHLSQDGIVTP